ncbi:unnamed protein product [Effrenium voratum]|nr:unnamed protein product [Effrenium voratum]
MSLWLLSYGLLAQRSLLAFAGSVPQGLGPQQLWPTPALLVLPPKLEAGKVSRWHVVLAGHIRHLARHAPLESWRSEGEDFLQQCAAAGGEVAVAASKLKSLLEEAALQYLQTALDERSPQLLSRLHTSIAASWARSGPRSWLVPHVHAKVALAGSFYLDCGGPLQALRLQRGADADGTEDDPAELCGVYLQDPRTPAGMAEVLESLRQKLGWGEAHHVRVRSGSLLLYPAWLQHAGLPPSLNSSSKEEAVSSVSFTVVVQLRESAERSPGQRSTSHQQEL